MVILTVILHSPVPDVGTEITDMRKALVELLFAEGNHNCPSCEKSGRCELQATGYEVDMMVSRFPYRFTPRVLCCR
jgi:[NiFe] hydrogenase diaphorase moiety small subunit